MQSFSHHSTLNKQWNLFSLSLYNSVVAMAKAPVSTLQNPASCLQSVFMCLVWFAAQIMVLSLMSINLLILLVVITGKHYVLCAVRSEFLDIMYINFVLQKTVKYMIWFIRPLRTHIQSRLDVTYW
jgi:hypothetical protein